MQPLKKMNGKEVKETLAAILEENDVDNHQFAWNDIEEETRDQIKLALGEFEHVQTERTEGGGDWDGAQAVFHFPEHNVYISVEGYYSSDNGMDFTDGLEVVHPVEVTTTVYKIVK